MLFKPDLIVYIWLIPAFIFFVFPFFFLPLILKIDRRGEAAVSFAADEHRAYPRQHVDGMYAHVSDGVNCCRVSVNNVSKCGISFVMPPNRLNDAKKLGVLLTGSGRSFPMEVKPQWKERHGTEQDIGAVIVNTPELWEEFATSFEGARRA